MVKSICFDAAGGGKRLFKKFEKYYVIAFVYNDVNKCGKDLVFL